MFRRSLMPLRVITGDPVPIESVEVTAKSDDARHLQVVALVRDDMEAIVAEERYSRYLPSSSDETGGLEPAPGMATFPRPLDLPFTPDVPFASFFGSGLPVEEQPGGVQDISRKLWVEIDVRLGGPHPRLIGGVLYSGLPYLPYDLTERGEISSNFGLPREIRISWSASDDDGFLDAEHSVIDQAIASHGGLHILPTGPVTTDRLRIRLADFPRFWGGLDSTVTPQRLTAFWGFVMPMLFVFQHAEKTRYRPSVPGGLVAAAVVPEGQSLSSAPEASAITGGTSSGYVMFSAASLFRPPRLFTSAAPGSTATRERFISRRLGPAEEIRIYFDQAEEYERCLGGLRLRFGAQPGSSGDLPDTTLQAQVYELDPVDGESQLLLELGGEYADPLVSTTITLAAEDPARTLPLRFVRPSSSRHFALVLRRSSEGSGVVVMHGVDLVQSADVVVAPRQSRSQIVRALHMRLIGPRLAEDYSRVGPEAFTLSVERLVAGARKDVLFSAETLLDLLQSGAARVYTNQRRRATEAELVQLDTRDGKPSFEERRHQGGSTGWRRSESGSGVDAFVTDTQSAEFQDWRGEQAPGSPGASGLAHGFNTFANQEARIHAESLFPHSSGGNEWQAAATWVNGLLQGTDLGSLLGNVKLIDDSDDNRLVRRNWQRKPVGIPNSVWEETVWRGLEVPRVLGMRNVTMSPFSPIASLGQMVGELQPLAADAALLIRRFANGRAIDLAALDATIGSLDALNDLLRAVFSGPFAILNAGSSGISVSPFGLGFSLSVPTPYPSISNVTSVGSTGSISMQASNTGYSYSQQLNSGFDEGRSRTEFLQSAVKRIVTRSVSSEEDTRRIRGAEVMWQEQLVDIVTVSIPLNLTLPATAGRAYRTSDDSLRVRFGNSVRPAVSTDVWFDVAEEPVPHDH